MMIVISIVAFLAALLFPLTSSLIARAKQATCLQNQRSLSQGLRFLAADRDNVFLWTSSPVDSGNNWHRNVWPYLYESGTYGNWASPELLTATKKTFVCPANPSKTAAISYGLNTQLRDRKLASIPGSAILLMDLDGNHTIDGSASALNLRLKGWHQGLNAVTFADGHAELLPRAGIPDRIANPALWGIPTN